MGEGEPYPLGVTRKSYEYGLIRMGPAQTSPGRQLLVRA
jgi:hypothetical protein